MGRLQNHTHCTNHSQVLALRGPEDPAQAQALQGLHRAHGLTESAFERAFGAASDAGCVLELDGGTLVRLPFEGKLQPKGNQACLGAKIWNTCRQNVAGRQALHQSLVGVEEDPKPVWVENGAVYSCFDSAGTKVPMCVCVCQTWKNPKNHSWACESEKGYTTKLCRDQTLPRDSPLLPGKRTPSAIPKRSIPSSL